MDLAVILDLIAVFFAGLLAGVEFALHYGVRSPTAVLNERSQLQLRQALVRRLRVMVPALFLPTAVVAVVATAVGRSGSGEWLQLAGVLALLAWIVIRVVGTVPINRATLSWSLDAPPGDWTAQVRDAERFHDVGVGAAIVAFACFPVPLPAAS